MAISCDDVYVGFMSTVEPFDVNNEHDFAGWMRVTADTDADLPYDVNSTEADVRSTFTRGGQYSETRGYVCKDAAGQIVGWARLDLPLKDNTTLAEVGLGVGRAVRNHGHGSALAARVLGEARDAGRRSVTVSLGWPSDSDTSPGRRFAERHGLTLRTTMLHQVLLLPVPSDQVDRLAAEAARYHASYEIIGWDGPCPEEWVQQFADSQSRMVDEVPMGDLEIEPVVFDVARVREREDSLVDRGCTWFTSLAIVEGDAVVGFTQLNASQHELDAFQWDTLVLPEQRGHRLGLALKAYNLQLFRKAGLRHRAIHTWNAVTNGPMISVNDRFGFFPASFQGEFQGAL